MEQCSLAQRLHSWSLGIAINLNLSLPPLFLDTSLIRFFRFSLFPLWHQLQLQNITMLGFVMCEIWQEEEIAIAVSIAYEHYCLECQE